MNVAEVLVKALEHEHVEYMFGIPGEENLYIMKALKESGKIKVVIVRHEQGAAFMADVYGRLTGRAGVCFSTLGPGATNLITGVADANGDGAPLVAITAQVSTDKMPLTSHQYLDLETLFQPITRRTKMIVAPGSTNEIVRLAFKYAEGRHPGATHICIPQDVSSMEVPEIRNVADICYVFYNGSIIGTLRNDQIDETSVMRYSTNSIGAQQPGRGGEL